jgi:hypothetical protein
LIGELEKGQARSAADRDLDRFQAAAHRVLEAVDVIGRRGEH